MRRRSVQREDLGVGRVLSNRGVHARERTRRGRRNEIVA